MDSIKFISLFALAFVSTLCGDESNNNGRDPGDWNQNPHRYGNWNRNQYENQPGAYQNNNSRPEQQTQYQYQKGQISAVGEDNPVPPTPVPTNEKTYSETNKKPLPESTKADTKITREIQENLLRESSLSTQGRQVIVSTTNGVVTLQGHVLTPGESAKIESLVKKIDGVKGINNQLQPINTTNSLQQPE